MISGARKTWIGSFLIALLVLTGHSMVIARGHLDTISGTIVICSGTEVVMVHLDENGEPTEAPRFCPDGALSFFFMGTVGGGVATASAAEWQNAPHLSNPATSSFAIDWPAARGPPFTV